MTDLELAGRVLPALPDSDAGRPIIDPDNSRTVGLSTAEAVVPARQVKR